MRFIGIPACLWAAALLAQTPGNGDLTGYLELNDTQVAQLQQIRGDRARAAEPYRQQAMAVLTESQKQKLRALEDAQKLCGLAREASRLGLLARGGPSSGTTASVEPAPGSVRLSGELVSGGAECQRFQSSDGKFYMLEGNLQGFRTGDRVEITATPMQASHCMQDTPIRVDAIRRLQ